MSKAIAVFDMPNSCIDCPMVSSYGRKCKLSKKSFAKKELISMTGRYPFKYKPEWCELKEFDDAEALAYTE